MTTRKLWVNKDKKLFEETVPYRDVPKGYVAVKPKAVALNPTDVKHLWGKFSEGAGSGCDFAGEVVAIGPGVSEYKIGDTVAGGVSGSFAGRPEDGAFASVIIVPPHTLFKLPGLVTNKSNKIAEGPPQSFEQAASLGIGLDTAALAYIHYDHGKLVKNSKSGYALIYGAVSSLGYQAAQLAKYLGYEVIAVASKKHGPLLESIGVKHLIDYHDKDWPQQAKKIGGEDIVLAYDTITEGKTFLQVYEAVSSTKPAKIHLSLFSVPKPDRPKPNVTVDKPVYYFLWDNVKYFGKGKLEDKDDIAGQRPLILGEINRLLSEGAIKALPVEIVGDGFSAIPALVERYATGVSGTKIVARL